LAKSKQIGFLGRRFLRKPARIRGFSESEVLIRWPEILPAYAAYSRPKSLNRSGVLEIVTNSASAANNMQMQGQALIDRINQFFGYGAVKKLRFVVTGFLPKLEEPIKRLEADEKAEDWAVERCKDVQDTELRERLEKLGALIEMENRQK